MESHNAKPSPTLRVGSASSRPPSGSQPSSSPVAQRCDLDGSTSVHEIYEGGRKSNCSAAATQRREFPHDEQAQTCKEQEQWTANIHKTQSRASDDTITVIQPQNVFVVGTWREAEDARDKEHGHAQGESSDRTPLIGTVSSGYGTTEASSGASSPKDAVIAIGEAHTRWQTEAKLLGRYSRSLIATFLLQYSLLVTSVFAVGHLGKAELAAVSLATMTANITGYAVYQGLATSLDTLAAQAYGSGRKKLVGLQLQRMTYFLWAITIPIIAIWACSTMILEAIVPDRETARLAGTYLRILTVGAPGYAAFESGKRFVQAQGLFSATLYCLIVCAPLNAAMNYLFVWYLEWGFVGAPIAISITQTLLPLSLFCYVYCINGRECWGGLDRRAFHNWRPMIGLAIPGLVAFLAEFLAFEILTLAAARLGTTALAAQSILTTVMAITFQLPFPIAIGASTRVANLIGSRLPDAAKVTAMVAMVAATVVGLLNATLLASLTSFIPSLFTQDVEVLDAAANALPVCAALQIFDALASNLNGILRGLGRQAIGGYVGLIAFYIVGLPISFGTGFGLKLGLPGLWAGPVIGLAVVSVVEAGFICCTSWQRACEEAAQRDLQEGFVDE